MENIKSYSAPELEYIECESEGVLCGSFGFYDEIIL